MSTNALTEDLLFIASLSNLQHSGWPCLVAARTEHSGMGAFIEAEWGKDGAFSMSELARGQKLTDEPVGSLDTLWSATGLQGARDARCQATHSVQNRGGAPQAWYNH